MGMILSCKCDHAFQNKTYGTGMRLYVPRIKEQKLLGYRCTVCGAEQSGNSGVPEKKGKK